MRYRVCDVCGNVHEGTACPIRIEPRGSYGGEFAKLDAERYASARRDGYVEALDAVSNKIRAIQLDYNHDVILGMNIVGSVIEQLKVEYLKGQNDGNKS
jgi:hypothetical protein